MAPLFKVQDGVPMPGVDRTSKAGRRKYPVEGMKVGQMFFVPGKKTRSVSAYISRITKDLPGKYSARYCWMKKHPEGAADIDATWALCTPDVKGAIEGVGVWRVE